MDDLMTKIMNKIQDRQKQVHQITYSENADSPDVRIFVDYANVDIMTVSLELLRNLYELRQNDPWVNWIMKGFEYDIKFRFEVSMEVAQFLPIKMILDWPILFVVDAKRPVHSLRAHFISRAQLAELADHSVVVLKQDQKLTSEALELVRRKDIQIQVRNDAECLWQKL